MMFHGRAWLTFIFLTIFLLSTAGIATVITAPVIIGLTLLGVPELHVFIPWAVAWLAISVALGRRVLGIRFSDWLSSRD